MERPASTVLLVNLLLVWLIKTSQCELDKEKHVERLACQSIAYKNERKCVSYKYGSDSIQVIDCHLPKSDQVDLVVLMIHGGYWDSRNNRSLEDDVANDLLSYGIVVCNLDYRSVGNQGGFPNTFYDVSNGTDLIPLIGLEQSFSTGKVIFVGHSAGGQLAGYLSGRFRLKQGEPGFSEDALRPVGLVSQSGVNSMWDGCDQYKQTGNGAVIRFLDGVYRDHPERYLLSSVSSSSQKSISSLYPSRYLPLNIPVQCITGVKDETVPVEQTIRFGEECTESGDLCSVVLVENEDHFAHLNSSSVCWSRTRQFILSFIDRK